jgi:replicative DNA helicase
MLGDGSFRKNNMGYCNNNKKQIDIVAEASKIFDTNPKCYLYNNNYQLYFRAKFQPSKKNHHPIVNWLKSIGLLNKLSYEKFVPKEIYSLDKKQIALFLNHLWMTDGSIGVRDNRVGLYYCSNSYQLALDVHLLLCKLGILSVISTVPQKGYKDNYWVVINSSKEQLKFLSMWDFEAPKGEIAQKACKILESKKINTNVDTIPQAIWQYILQLLKKQQITHRQFAKKLNVAYSGTARHRNSISRPRLIEIANVLNDSRLQRLSESDIFWDEIKNIQFLGEQKVYDLTTKKNHNFVANNIILHNSLEADADIVAMLYRDYYYSRNQEHKHICEILIRKFRNGETGKVVVEYNVGTQSFKSIKPNTKLFDLSKRFYYE